MAAEKVYSFLSSEDPEFFHLGVITFLETCQPVDSLTEEQIVDLYYKLQLHDYLADQIEEYDEYKKYVLSIRAAFKKIYSY